MNIIILGPQGSGKGTQAKLIAHALNLNYFESGGFLRELAEKDARVDEIINKKGELLPDEEMFSYMSRHLEESLRLDNLLFDGYPRSVKQYELLKNWLRGKGETIDLVIFLDVSEKESIKRLSARRICEKCGAVYNLITDPPPESGCRCGGDLIQREDDKTEVIKRRLSLYKEETESLIEIFEKEGILMKVDGERPIDTIFTDIMQRIKGKNEQN